MTLPVTVPATIPADAVDRLATGEVSLVGRMPNASNATFLVTLEPADTGVSSNGDGDRDGEGEPYGLAIYKPGRGERPLWDFPPGLYRREVAAFRLSAATGLDVIPPTVLRGDAPLGEGSLQWFVNADFGEHYFSLMERPELHDQLRALAVFDVIANNTDRKSGHCLFEPRAGRVWGIDNGLCFSLDARLRTVIWDFAGDELGTHLRGVAAKLADCLPPELDELLAPDEAAAICERADRLAARGSFPDDPTGRGHPWPLI